MASHNSRGIAALAPAILLLPLLVATGAVLAFGWDSFVNRFNVLDDAAVKENRLSLWRNGLAAIPGTWRCGAGNGTFEYVEPLARKTEDPALYAEHAHNEYLEALVEGAYFA